MKRIIKSHFYTIGLLLLITACKKDSPVVLPTFEATVQAKSLTMFNSALEKANLKDFKTGPGPFTWFAPTDAAFTAAGITTDSLNKISPNALSYILLYHLVNAKYTGEDMIAVNSISRTTQMGGAIYNGSYNGSYYVNGAKISSADNQVQNGYIHVTDRFLTPPQLRGNVVSILNATGQHALFIAALTRAGLLATLNSASIFTVLAPTDAAMTAAGYTSTVIAAAVPATLAGLLRYHYFNNARLFTNDLASDNITIPTAQGPTFSLVTSENGTKIKGKGNVTPVTITSSDRLGTNGVVHIIDGFLRQ